MLSFEPSIVNFCVTRPRSPHWCISERYTRLNGGIVVTHEDCRPPHSALARLSEKSGLNRATIPGESCEAVCVTSGHAGKQQTATCLRSTARTSLHCTLHTATNRSIDVYFHALPLHFRLAVRQLGLHVQSTKHEHARLRYSPVSVHW